MAPTPSAAASSNAQRVFASRRLIVVASGGPPGQSSPLAWSSSPTTGPAAVISQGLLERQIATISAAPKPMPVLSPATTTAAAADASLPSTFARIVVGAALALSTVYALLSSPASSATDSAFVPTAAPPTPMDADAKTATASPSATTTTASSSSSSATATATAIAAAPAFPSLPILRSPEQFDAFVLASNRAGYLAIVLFHAPWCAASARMETELQRLSRLVANRRVVFARADCSIKLASRSQPTSTMSVSISPFSSMDDDGARLQPTPLQGQVQGLGAGLERCGLTQLHRIHKTPTVRMYYGNACVDEVVGCRPVDFRQTVSDLTFKYKL